MKVAVGQVWIHPHPMRRLTRYRVMAIVEGYVMYRDKHAMPGLLHWKEFERNFVPYEPPPQDDYTVAA